MKKNHNFEMEKATRRIPLILLRAQIAELNQILLSFNSSKRFSSLQSLNFAIDELEEKKAIITHINFRYNIALMLIRIAFEDATLKNDSKEEYIWPEEEQEIVLHKLHLIYKNFEAIRDEIFQNQVIENNIYAHCNLSEFALS